MRRRVVVQPTAQFDQDQRQLEDDQQRLKLDFERLMRIQSQPVKFKRLPIDDTRYNSIGLVVMIVMGLVLYCIWRYVN